jgi:hypothetical protein
VLSGLWGILAAGSFFLSQVNMIVPGMPLSLVVRSFGQGFLLLFFYLFISIAIVIYAFLSIRNQAIRFKVTHGFLLVTFILGGLAIIPGSSTGPVFIPTAIGTLASAFLIRG